jgi:predicted CXXCH cytochrome family protein
VIACSGSEELPGGEAPRAEPTGEAASQAAYVTDASCVECHPQQFEKWTGSHHDLAMQLADTETVLGDFGGSAFTHFGVTSRFFQRDGRFFVNTEGPDGRLADFEIRYTFGFTPLQQYLVEFPGGRLQSLTIAWDTARGRWFHLYPDERIAHDDPLHWTGRYQRWNAMCAECHSTDLEERYDPATDTYRTTWREIDVGCQACHGPGGEHDAWARTLKEGEEPNLDESALWVNFRTGDSRYEVDVCAPCHSRRYAVSAEDRPGRPFLDDFMPQILREGLYYADGQILEEVYVYGSFLQSKMYAQGVRCSDCHDSHSARLKAEGNALCLQCHLDQVNPRFPALVPKRYDVLEHHFHPEGKPGTLCVECHMPTRTYMVVDPRFDHSFRVPRPDLTQTLGTPDVCSGCHSDQSVEWSVEAVAKWYGPERQRDASRTEAIAAGRAGAPGAEARLIGLALDPNEPAIFRATALDLLRAYGPAGGAALVEAATDPDPLVRAYAVRGLDRLPPEARLESVAPLLEDPIRAVRSEAARVLASLPRDRFDATQRRAFEEALAEFEEAHWAQADLPSAHLNLAVVYASLDQLERAERSYRTAIGMDPAFLPARANLAHLYNGMGRNAEAERVLGEALERAPDQGELHYSLGLLLAEEQRLDAAAASLARAAELLPGRARVRYNLALALQHLGRRAEAEAALLDAHRIDARDPDVLQALAILYAQRGELEEARYWAEKLVALAPGAPGPLQLLRRIREEQSSGSR